jgi:hypothetical protein
VGAGAGAEATGGRVVVVGGGLVGYLRVAEPTALPVFEAELPMLEGMQWEGEWLLGCIASIRQ